MCQDFWAFCGGGSALHNRGPGAQPKPYVFCNDINFLRRAFSRAAPSVCPSPDGGESRFRCAGATLKSDDQVSQRLSIRADVANRILACNTCRTADSLQHISSGRLIRFIRWVFGVPAASGQHRGSIPAASLRKVLQCRRRHPRHTSVIGIGAIGLERCTNEVGDARSNARSRAVRSAKIHTLLSPPSITPRVGTSGTYPAGHIENRPKVSPATRA